MTKFINITVRFIAPLFFTLTACNETETLDAHQKNLNPKTSPNAKEIVFQMIDKVGDYKKLRSKKDVVYQYTYQTPDGKTDVSTEKYRFSGELSYGKYDQHERTLPHLEGIMEQGFDGKNYWLKLNGKEINDSSALKKVQFNRPTNFYWFTMFPKLADPGVNYNYLQDTIIGNQAYDVVKISFDSPNNQPTDIYQLYINQETKLVDQFLFTVVDYGVVETPYLMQLKYEEIDGLILPTDRRYKKSTWDATVDESPWITVKWSDIQFNQGLTEEDFRK